MYRFTTTITYDHNDELDALLAILQSFGVDHSYTSTQITLSMHSRITFVLVYAALVDYYAGG